MSDSELELWDREIEEEDGSWIGAFIIAALLVAAAAVLWYAAHNS